MLINLGRIMKKLMPLHQMTRPSEFEWLTATEAAAYLKVQPRSLLLWTRQGKIIGYALSGTKRRIWRFRKSDLDAALHGSPVLACTTLTVLSERRTS
jgi:excisionase family DNA binding protein